MEDDDDLLPLSRVFPLRKQPQATMTTNVPHPPQPRAPSDDADDVEEVVISIGDLVWVKAFPFAWWPGWVRRRRLNRSTSLVSFFGDEKSEWFHESKLLPFEENYRQKSRIAGAKLDDEVGLALVEAGRRMMVGLMCRCQRSVLLGSRMVSVRQMKRARRGFSEAEALGFVRRRAVCVWSDDDDTLDVVRFTAQIIAFRRYLSSLPRNDEVVERLNPGKLLKSVFDMAINLQVDSEGAFAAGRAAEIVTAYRNFVSVTPVWVFQELTGTEGDGSEGSISDSSSDDCQGAISIPRDEISANDEFKTEDFSLSNVSGGGGIYCSTNYEAQFDIDISVDENDSVYASDSVEQVSCLVDNSDCYEGLQKERMPEEPKGENRPTFVSDMHLNSEVWLKSGTYCGMKIDAHHDNKTDNVHGPSKEVLSSLIHDVQNEIPSSDEEKIQASNLSQGCIDATHFQIDSSSNLRVVMVDGNGVTNGTESLEVVPAFGNTCEENSKDMFDDNNFALNTDDISNSIGGGIISDLDIDVGDAACKVTAHFVSSGNAIVQPSDTVCVDAQKVDIKSLERVDGHSMTFTANRSRYGFHGKRKSDQTESFRQSKLRKIQPALSLRGLYASPLMADSSSSANKVQLLRSVKCATSHKTLHMKFPKDFKLPLKEDLEKKFRAFGPLDYSRTKLFFYTGAAQVVFLHSADAEAARHYGKNKKIFKQVDVLFWFDEYESLRPENRHEALSKSVGQPSLKLKSILRKKNACGERDQKKKSTVKFLV